jgi:hypothetical protein
MSLIGTMPGIALADASGAPHAGSAVHAGQGAAQFAAVARH